MKASEDIRSNPGRFFFYGTEAGLRAWQANRDQLREKAETQRLALVPERKRDVFDQQDGYREYDLTMRSLAHVEQVLAHFKTIEPATDVQLVDIGTIVTYQQFDEQGHAFKPATLQVGEYGADDFRANPPVMSYDNHLLLPLIGSRVGDTKTITLTNRRENEFEILDIRLPETYPPLKLAV